MKTIIYQCNIHVDVTIDILIFDNPLILLFALLQAAAAKKEKEAQKKLLKKERKTLRTAVKVRLLKHLI